MEREADAPRRGFPLAEPPRFAVLRAFCAVAEGADVLVPSPVEVLTADTAAETGVGAACVAAVLGDAQRRLSILGGRSEMPRSLGSVLGSFVVRFVGGGLRGVESRAVKTLNARSVSNGVAVSRDGSTLLVSHYENDAHAGVRTFCVHTGVHFRTIGGAGNGPLQFHFPCQVWVASDDFVFVADQGNNRIQILTPRAFDFHRFVGVGQLEHPSGVCAGGEHIIVSESGARRISVFSRGDGTLLRRFGSKGRCGGQLAEPTGLCLMPGDRDIAVADTRNNCVSVFSVYGEFVRTVSIRELDRPHCVACSAFGELVVASWGNTRVVVFSASGEMLHTMRGDRFADVAMDYGHFTGVATHNGAIFAQTWRDKCLVFT